MKRIIFIIALLILLTANLFAQFGPVRSPRYLGKLASDPATCNTIIPTWYFNTSSSEFKYCSALNTFSSMGGGGGGVSYTTSGTTNYVPKFDGTGFADSDITDNGTTVTSSKPFTVSTGGATDIPLSVSAAAAQTANLFNITSSGGSAGDLFNVSSNGTVKSDNFYGIGSSVNFGSNSSNKIDFSYGVMNFTSAGVQTLRLQNNVFYPYIAGLVSLGSAARPWGGLYTYQPIASKTTGYLVTTAESNSFFTNEGATSSVAFTLPGAAGVQQYKFAVQDSDGMTITASAGDTIRIGTSVTATGGTITSTAIGSSLILQSINTTEWVAISSVGTWTF